MSKKGETKEGKQCLLSEVEIGSVSTITKVNGEGKLRRRILDMGLTPNTQVYLRKKAPLGDPLEITLRGYELTLRKDEASQIEVKIISLAKKEK